MILTLNAGSSSLRFSLFDESLTRIYQGHIDAIGQDHCKYRRYFENGTEKRWAIQAKNHKAAITFAIAQIESEGVLDSLNEIKKVAHRVVHGGERFKAPTKLTAKTLEALDQLTPLAPLHNPANLDGIRAAQKLLPKAAHYAIFDTAFHSTLPEHAYLYGLPYALYKKEGLRRYGFHGSSHRYVAEEAQRLLKRKKLKLITCHMGNGVSVSAIKDGVCLDTSMGFTPLEGPMMGTRSGSIDPAIIFHLAKQMPLKQVEHLLQKESGFLGLSGKSSDIRELKRKMDSKETQRVFQTFSYQMAKLILSYGAALDGAPDAIVFTAGIGEHADYLRSSICAHLKVLSVRLDAAKNRAHATVISSPNSAVQVLVIPTDEERQMANELEL